MDIKDVKAMKKLIQGKVFGIILGLLLCVNLPFVILVCKDKYKITILLLVILYVLMLQLVGAIIISNYIFKHYFKIVDNGQEVNSSMNKRYKIVLIMLLIIICLVFPYMIFHEKFSVGIFWIYLFNILSFVQSETYIGKNYILYRNTIIKIDDILIYSVITKKKYKNNKKDKIQLKLKLINSGLESILIYNSKLSYSLKDKLDKWHEKKFVEEKM